MKVLFLPKVGGGPDGREDTQHVAYLAPEFLNSTPALTANQATDVYSFGVMMNEVLSGTQPFSGLEASEIMMLVVRDPNARPPGFIGEIRRAHV